MLVLQGNYLARSTKYKKILSFLKVLLIGLPTPPAMKHLKKNILIGLLLLFIHGKIYLHGQPFITLSGPCVITLTAGQNFVEPGWVARDSANNDVSNMVMVSSNLDTAKAGTYTIVYCVGDGSNTRCTKRTILVNKAGFVNHNDTIKYDIFVPPLFHFDTITKMVELLKARFNLNITQITGTVDSARTGNYPLAFLMPDSACHDLNLLLNVHVVDTIKLGITLLGPPNLCIELNAPYIEPGYFYYDNYWPHSSLIFNITNTVDSSHKGIYFVSYTLISPSGFTRTVARSVQVGDCNTGLSKKAESHFQISPNPANELLLVERIGSQVSIKTILLYDCLGQLVLKQIPGDMPASGIVLKTADLLPGIYFLKIESNTGWDQHKICISH